MGSCSGYIRTSGLWLLGGPNCPLPPPTYLEVISRIQHLLQQPLCGNTPPCSQADLAQGINDWTGASPGLRSLSECSALLRRPCVSSWLPWRLSVKESACNVGDASLIPGWEGTLEEEMAVHSSILAWMELARLLLWQITLAYIFKWILGNTGFQVYPWPQVVALATSRQNIYEIGSGQCLWDLRKKWIQRCFCGGRGPVSILYGVGGLREKNS